MRLEEYVEDKISGIGDSMRKLGFELFFQPIVDPFDGNRIVGAEGLMRRYSNEEERYLSPGEFFPFIKNKGLGRNIDILAFESALELLTYMDSIGHSNSTIPINVNLSDESLKDESLVILLREIHQRYPDIDTSMINFEITEGVLDDDCSALAENLRNLHSFGYKISVDDVGTGNSTMARVRDYPVSCLKFDKSFVHSLDDDPENFTYAYLKKIMEMQDITTRDIKFIVEGVEREDQARNFYKNFPYHQHQGFYHSRPVQRGELVKYLCRKH